MAKISLTTARKPKKTTFHLPSTHVTTLDVGQTRPTNIFIASPGDSFDINLSQFSRLSPLVTPTFGSFSIRTHAFFVPFRSIFERFEDWMVRSKDNSIDPRIAHYSFSLFDIFYAITGTAVPTTESLFDTIVQQGYLTYVEHGTTGTYPTKASDVFFNKLNASGTPTDWSSWKLTAKGKNLFNVLRSLGYEIPETIRFAGSMAYADALTDTAVVKYRDWLNTANMSFFPLLAFGRVLYDYIYPSRFIQQQGLGYLFTDTITDDAVTPTQIFSDVLKLLFTKYDDDFFTNLWMSFNSPNGTDNNFGSVSGDSVDSIYSSVNNSLLGDNSQQITRVQQLSGGYTTTLTSYALSWLQKVSDYVLRNGIGGNRFNEWMKSHFGFVTKDQDALRSVYLKTFRDDVKIGDVTNTNLVDGSIAEQAGKAWSQGNGNLKYDVKEHGFLIFITSVLPSTGYYQGMKPWTNALSVNTDLYTPEFDSLGNEAIPRKALFSCYGYDRVKGEASGNFDFSKVPVETLNNVLGFAPKYAWLYKTSFDYLTGDFRFSTQNANLDSYHTFRNVLYGRLNLAIDAQFMSVDNQYDRIFAEVPDGQNPNYAVADKIFSIFQFDVKKSSYMLSLGESMPLFEKKGENTSVSYLGSEVN